MFRFQRTARIRSGKGSQAIQWAKDIAKYLNENYPPASSQAYGELFIEGSIQDTLIQSL